MSDRVFNQTTPSAFNKTEACVWEKLKKFYNPCIYIDSIIDVEKEFNIIKGVDKEYYYLNHNQLFDILKSKKFKFKAINGYSKLTIKWEKYFWGRNE